MMSESQPSPKKRTAVGIAIGILVPAALAGAGFLYSANEQQKWEARMAAKQAELDAIDSEIETIKALLDSRDTMIAVIDSEGRVVQWNPAAERYSGRTEQEMLGQTLERVMGSEQWKRHDRLYRQFLRNKGAKGKVQIIECAIKHKDPDRKGRMLRVRVQVSGPFNPDTGAFARAIALGDPLDNVIDLTQSSP